MSLPEFSIRPTTPQDREWIKEHTIKFWSDEYVVVHGKVYYPHALAGYIAEDAQGNILGLATYQIQNQECELVTLSSSREGIGIGSELLQEIRAAAEAAGCSRIWLITTNDNLKAMAFYEKRGFSRVKVYPGAVEESRKLKPSLPKTSEMGIPIRDEVEFELELSIGSHG